MKLDYLVTGTGRCGTVYAARLLTSVGVSCGHETIFTFDGLRKARERLGGIRECRLSTVSTRMRLGGSLGSEVWGAIKDDWVDLNELKAESSAYAAPFLHSDVLSDTKKIHLIKNPFSVVHSYVNKLGFFGKRPANQWERFLWKELPCLGEDMKSYDKACLFYIKWNQMIENSGAIKCRVEDTPQGLFDILGVSTAEYFTCQTVNEFPLMKRSHFRDISQIEDSYVRNSFVEVGERYGYNMRKVYMV